MFLTEAYIEEMTCALPLSEKTLWREKKACVSPNRYDAAFWTFVNDRLLQTSDKAGDVRRTLPLPTSSPINAAKSGSGGGRHSKGKIQERKATRGRCEKTRRFPGVPALVMPQQEFVGAAAQANVQRNPMRVKTPV